MFVVLRKENGGGGDNGGAEGVTGWKMFCTGDNGGAVNENLGLLLGGGDGRSDGNEPCEGGGGGGGRKFESKLFLIIF